MSDVFIFLRTGVWMCISICYAHILQRGSLGIFVIPVYCRQTTFICILLKIHITK